MVGRPAARILDLTAHPLPCNCMPGPGSPNVFIGKRPAWRAIPGAAAAGLQAAKTTSDTTVKAAEAATLAAAGTPGAPAAYAAEQTAKTAALQAMNAAVNAVVAGGGTPSGGVPDIHLCLTPSPMPPHGMGVVRDGSRTVFINGLPASRLGDHLIEALGPENIIVTGEFTVLIGDDAGSAGPVPPLPATGPNQAIYTSADEAARAAIAFTNPQSVNANLEMGGLIYQDPTTGNFGYTMATFGPTGGSLTSAPIPAGTTEAGFYHTHGDYSQPGPGGTVVRTSDPTNDGYNSDHFSGTDINTANSRGTTAYLGTPSGQMERYDPNSGPPPAPAAPFR